MALFEDLMKGGNIVTGLAVAAGATLLAPVLMPALTQIVRPAAKTAIKAGLVLYDRGRETVAELGEVASDVVAEARAEMDEDQALLEVDEASAGEDTEAGTARAARTRTGRKSAARKSK